MKKNIENSDAAISTESTLALAGVRWRKKLSGASGDRDRDSIRMNSAISASAAASSAIVRVDPQPKSSALTSV